MVTASNENNILQKCLQLIMIKALINSMKLKMKLFQQKIDHANIGMVGHWSMGSYKRYGLNKSF